MSKSSISLHRTLICGSFMEGVMEFPPFSATTTGEKASQTDGFRSIRRINRYPPRSRDKDAPPRLRISALGSVSTCALRGCGIRKAAEANSGGGELRGSAHRRCLPGHKRDTDSTPAARDRHRGLFRVAIFPTRRAMMSRLDFSALAFCCSLWYKMTERYCVPTS